MCVGVQGKFNAINEIHLPTFLSHNSVIPSFGILSYHMILRYNLFLRDSQFDQISRFTKPIHLALFDPWKTIFCRILTIFSYHLFYHKFFRLFWSHVFVAVPCVCRLMWSSKRASRCLISNFCGTRCFGYRCIKTIYEFTSKRSSQRSHLIIFLRFTPIGRLWRCFRTPFFKYNF